MINNRDLSWLNFNNRVLQEAQDKTVPLLQRLRFLGIFSNNLDEFIKVRVANVIRLSQIKGKKVPLFSGNYTPRDLLIKIKSKIAESQLKFDKIYNEIILEMEEHGIYMLNEKQLTKKQEAYCRDYFSRIISPRLVPLIIRKRTAIPFLTDSNIYHAVKMQNKNKEDTKYAIIQIPVSNNCPRFIELPSEKGLNDIIFLDDIIRLCLDHIFFMFNYSEISAYTFKLTRDALLTVDDDVSKSLIEKMEDGLENRMHGQPVRLIYDKEMPEDLLGIIISKLKLKDDDSCEAGERYHLKKDLMKFPKIRPDLEYINPTPLIHNGIKPSSSILTVVKKKDILLNYPYHTFNHFIDFLREAAIDPKVESISITLYRTAEHSKVINALVNAAKNGKRVTAVLELFARFDEEQNVENTELLQKAGVKVIHGADGLKVHSKLVLVERAERKEVKGYVYVGTGNFNESTALVYGDFGLFTAEKVIVADTRRVFDFLENTHKHFQCDRLMVSPYYMRRQFEQLIENEIKNAKKGINAYIYAKFNSLTDENIIKLLYKAADEGVTIRLIIRGACCIKTKSENIKAISIVDKYLEHARLVIFGNGGKEEVFILSADWMTRNLDRRVEVGIPVLDVKVKETLKSFFDIQWSDNVKSRDLNSPDQNSYIERIGDQKNRSQIMLYDFYKKMYEDRDTGCY